MPIRFRCPGCEGLLSIATRKAGSEIGCPKCGEGLIVPPPVVPAPDLEPGPSARRPAAEFDEDAPTEVDLAPPPRRLEPVGAGAKAARRAGAAPRVRNFLEGDEPPAVVEAERPKPKATPGDEPLFERSDFERLLDPVVKKTADTAEGSKSDATRPLKSSPAEPPSAAAAARLGLPVVENGVYISLGTAVMLVVLFVFLLGLAFALGFWAGTM